MKPLPKSLKAAFDHNLLLRRWILWAIAILVFAQVGVCFSTASGVTVITHGWQLNQSYPAWVDTMARAVTNAALSFG